MKPDQPCLPLAGGDALPNLPNLPAIPPHSPPNLSSRSPQMMPDKPYLPAAAADALPAPRFHYPGGRRFAIHGDSVEWMVRCVVSSQTQSGSFASKVVK